MKIFNLRNISVILLTLFAGMAVAQTKYCGEVITHFGFTEAGYQANAILLTIEKTGDLTARVYAEPVDEARTLDVLILNGVTGATVSAETTVGRGLERTLTYATAPSSIVISEILWSDNVMGGNEMYTGIDAAFATCGTVEGDTEAPTNFALVGEPVAAATSVSFVVKATDNSGSVTYTATVGDQTATAYGNSDTETTVVVKGLAGETEYDYTITASDGTNVCETTLTGKVTTTKEIEKVWYGAIEAGEGTYAPAINYSITYNADQTLTMNFTLSEGYEGLVPEVNFDGKGIYTAATSVAGVDLQFIAERTDAFEEGTTLNGFFWLKYAGGVYRADFTYTVGAENEPIVPVEDTEAPVVAIANVKEFSYNSATLIVKVTDNISKSAKIEVSADDFATTLVSKSIACDSEVEVIIEGLAEKTEYNLKARATDAAGNVSEVKAFDSFTTLEAPNFEVVECKGQIIGEDKWGEKGTPMNWDKVYTPNINYVITAMADNTLKFNLQLSEVCTGLVPQVWINNVLVIRPAAVAGVENTFEGTTTETYTRGTEVQVRFRFEYAGGVSTVKDFPYTIGSDVPSAIKAVSTTDVRYAGGVVYNDGSQVEVYNLMGVCVARSYGNIDLNAMPAGVYIVRVDGEVAMKVAR